VITTKNCLNCMRTKLLLQGEDYLELDSACVTSSILDMGNGEYPMVFKLMNRLI